MASKQFALDEHTSITIYKRKGSRNLRLSIAPDGTIRVSIPYWVPYSAGVQFAKSRQAWINRQQRPQLQLAQGQIIGKSHRLRFIAADVSKVTTRVRASEVVVNHPTHLTTDSPSVQSAASLAATRALRLQAEDLLPMRLRELADEHSFDYGGVTIKRLKSRWGSCDHQGNIVLNLFLVQLPWDCIDYVLLHELTHTRLMKHGPQFWQAMENILPTVKQIRKKMRGYQPVLVSDTGMA